MRKDTSTVSTNLTLEEKRIFTENARNLGLNVSEVLRVFVKAFNEAGTLPSDAGLKAAFEEVRNNRSPMSGK